MTEFTIDDFKALGLYLNRARAMLFETHVKMRKRNFEYKKYFDKAVNGIDESRFALEYLMKKMYPESSDTIFYPDIKVRLDIKGVEQ